MTASHAGDDQVYSETTPILPRGLASGASPAFSLAACKHFSALIGPDWGPGLGQEEPRQNASCNLHRDGWSRWNKGKVHRPIERSINIFHRTLPHAQKRSKVMFPVDQGATKLMQGMSVCTLAHLWGGSNSYGQTSALRGSYAKSHLMK